MPYRNLSVRTDEQFTDRFVADLNSDVVASTSNAPNLSYLPSWNDSVVPINDFQLYQKIWDFYYRDPTDDADSESNRPLVSRSKHANIGAACGHIPTHWSAGLRDFASSDGDSFSATSTNDQLRDIPFSDRDLSSIKEAQAEGKEAILKEWFGRRYNEVMKSLYKVDGITKEDQDRPQLCMYKDFWLGGVNETGTGADSLGLSVGAQEASFSFDMPPKYFPEHGIVMVVVLVRYSPIHIDEVHYLERPAVSSPEDVISTYDVAKAKGFSQYSYADIFRDAPSSLGGNTLGVFPYGFWYRSHPNRVNRRYAELKGYPFLSWQEDFSARYINPRHYDDVFQTMQLRHWQLKCLAMDSVKRYWPTDSEIVTQEIR